MADYNEGANGTDDNLTDLEVEQLVNELLDINYDDEPSYNERLQEKVLAALDGPYRELRDDTHIAPHTVLVFTEGADGESDTVEAVDLSELPLRYPVAGKGARWCIQNLGELVASKALLYRQSKVAHELHDKDPTSEAPCGTPVLAVPVRPGPYYWFDVRARTLPVAEA
jgi:hypothetical protein